MAKPKTKRVPKIKAPKTTRVPKIKAPKGDNRFDSLNEGLAKLNKTLAGGITNVKNNDGSTIKGKVYFTPGGATDKTGKVRYTASGGTKTFGETGNTTGVTANPKNTEATEAGVVSSQQGENQLKQYQSDAQKLDIGLGTKESPLSDQQILQLEQQGIREGDTVPGKGRLHPGGYFVEDIPAPKGMTAPEPTATYVNENGASVTTTGAGAGSPEEQKKKAAEGFSLAESTTQAEDTQDPEIKKVEDEFKFLESEISAYKNKLIDLIISDTDLKSDIRAISKAYDGRIAEMRDITNRQVQSIKTLGYRLGAQYTGGMGGVWGGIISDAERQGILKIADIEGEKQSKILEAKAAARDNNYKIYASLMDDARALAGQKASALAELKKAQKEQDAKLAQQKNEMERDVTISALFMEGITDPASIVASTGYSLEEVDKALKILTPPDALKGLDADYQTFAYLQKIGDPAVEGLTWTDYSRMMANLKATASGANKTTQEERQQSVISSFASAFVPGATITVPNKDNPEEMVEISVIGPDNKANPTAFNAALNEAQTLGLTREKFITEFGHLVNPGQPNHPEYEQYNLSLAEFRAATGVEPNIGNQSSTGEALTPFKRAEEPQ